MHEVKWHYITSPMHSLSTAKCQAARLPRAAAHVSAGPFGVAGVTKFLALEQRWLSRTSTGGGPVDEHSVVLDGHHFFLGGFLWLKVV